MQVRLAGRRGCPSPCGAVHGARAHSVRCSAVASTTPASPLTQQQVERFWEYGERMHPASILG